MGTCFGAESGSFIGRPCDVGRARSARVLRFSRHFRRDRRYFAAVEAEIAQHAVIELAQCIVGSSRLPTLPVARVHSACDCANGPDRRDDHSAEDERAMRASGVVHLVTRRPREDAGSMVATSPKALRHERAPVPLLGVITGDRRVLADGIVAGGPAPQEDERGIAARAGGAGSNLCKCGRDRSAHAVENRLHDSNLLLPRMSPWASASTCARTPMTRRAVQLNLDEAAMRCSLLGECGRRISPGGQFCFVCFTRPRRALNRWRIDLSFEVDARALTTWLAP